MLLLTDDDEEDALRCLISIPLCVAPFEDDIVALLPMSFFDFPPVDDGDGLLLIFAPEVEEEDGAANDEAAARPEEEEERLK